jgi:RNA polymerase sigma factor (sigma-70 family)
MDATVSEVPAAVRPLASWEVAPDHCDQGNGRPIKPSLSFSSLLRRLAHEQRVPRDQVADLVQEAWLRMLTRFPEAAQEQFTAPSTAWLQCVVRSLAVDWYRKEKRRKTRCASVPVQADRYAEPDADPACHLDRCLDRELVGRFLRQLQREVSAENYRLFWLHWIEEQPVAALATAVNRGPAEISARLYRMMKKMQAYAARYRSDYGIDPREKTKKRVMRSGARRIYSKRPTNLAQQ